MKRCPTCDKEFPDSMRFCQTDGTPLVEAVKNEPPPDPYKTVVGSIKMDDDLLQLPEQDDPMKTMVSPSFIAPKAEPPKPESKSPEMPKFDQPSPNPAGFGDVKSPSPVGMPQNPMSSGDNDAPKSESPAPPKPFNDTPKIDSAPLKNDSPFDKPGSRSDSPFGQSVSGSSPFDKPASSSPFDKPTPPPSSASGGSSPFEKAPPPPYKDPTPFNEKSASPFGGSPFDSPSEPKNDPFKPSEWTPPPAPVSNWQDQGLGANTPFQPPPAGVVGGQNQTLGIITLILGIVGLLCLGFLTGVPALVTGFMTLQNVKKDPATYGGKVLAIIGMVLGALGTLWSVLYLIFIVYMMFAASRM